MTITIAAQRVVTGASGPEPEALTLVVDGQRIVEVRPGLEDGAEVVDGWIVPGYVDTHCHGGAGADFASPDADAVTAARSANRAGQSSPGSACHTARGARSSASASRNSPPCR